MSKKNRRKMRKALATMLAALLLVVVSVGATIAYLTSETKEVKNTFAVGKVAITLDEADVNVYGEKAYKADDTTTEEDESKQLADRVMTNDYKLMPGHLYVKDPTIHVTKGSEECYLFVKVVDEIEAIQDTTTIAAQMTANGWISLDGAENVFYLDHTINALEAEANIDVPVFESFKIKGDAKVEDYVNKTITIRAYAVQKDGFDSAAIAYENAPCNWNA